MFEDYFLKIIGKLSLEKISRTNRQSYGRTLTSSLIHFGKALLDVLRQAMNLFDA